MNRAERNKCYMCDAEAVNKEHVPPDSFFPKGFRKTLITVPSCLKHNNKNNLDVEYTRNIVVGYIATNDVAISHFQNKVIKSFRNSPRLLRRTLKGAIPTIIDGQETISIISDLARINLVMQAVAYAIYFKSFGNTYPSQWRIFWTSLFSPEAVFQGQPDGYGELRESLYQLRLTELTMPHPEIFWCGFNQLDEARIIYKFVFYEGFNVYAVGIPLFV
jgi:hypothetical protein